MFIDQCTYKSKEGKTRTRTLLRYGYRDNGKIKLKTIANLSDCSPDEISALKIALKEKGNLSYLQQLSSAKLKNGKFIGSIYALNKIAERLGINKALGNTEEAKRILWLVFARLIEQGSRLSAVRLAKNYCIGEILNMQEFNEDDLYKAQDWLYEEKNKIEQKLFFHKQKLTGKIANLFLYDVSSSYLEGEQNELAAFGYNRDRKKGKKQIVYGVLADEEGDPVTIQAFVGNTADSVTLEPQIQKIAQEFGIKTVTFIGDKGMIKSTGIKMLQDKNFHYITTITKSQIEKMVTTGVLQLELFTDHLGEIEIPAENVRYIYRRNPIRALEIKKNREDKIIFLQKKIIKANQYLKEHPKAKIEIQFKQIH